ncbi:hypothetical protein [Gudongella sp. DL1XJH-153]|uniref:hypothetical protein n=1 Tax=Gudongella sp. DL1XJH-153 TaxID=3409804 RepID=UPI003BB687FA
MLLFKPSMERSSSSERLHCFTRESFKDFPSPTRNISPYIGLLELSEAIPYCGKKY